MTEAHIPQGCTKRTNRNPCKQWFITFPQTQVDKHTFRDVLAHQLCHLKYYKIAQETHQDGGLHLHAAVVLTQSMSKSQILKKLKIIYPNDYKRIDVQSVRSIKHSLAYLSKEDQQPLESAEPYQDPRNPYNSINLKMSRQWGFNSVEAFKTHMQEYNIHRRAQESRFLEMVLRVEQVIQKYPSQLINDPDIRHLIFYKNMMMKRYNYDTSITKDDMTKFTELFNSTVELL